jgi:HEPN domain-containing protein
MDVANLEEAKAFAKMASEDLIAGQCSNVPYSICFHAQQAAEKYLKAMLAFYGKPIPKTHDLSRLVALCAEVDQSFAGFSDAAQELNLFGVEIRYQPSKEEAEKRCPEAWSALLSILDAVKKQLPRELTE